MEHPWTEAADALPKASELKTVDQKIAYAQTCALLAIGRELEKFNLGESEGIEEIVAAIRTPQTREAERLAQLVAVRSESARASTHGNHRQPQRGRTSPYFRGSPPSAIIANSADDVPLQRVGSNRCHASPESVE